MVVGFFDFENTQSLFLISNATSKYKYQNNVLVGYLHLKVYCLFKSTQAGNGLLMLVTSVLELLSTCNIHQPFSLEF